MARLLSLAVAALLVAASHVEVAARGGGSSVTMTAQVPHAGSVIAIEERRRELFERMLRQPGDLDAAFEYAMLSIQVNDLEAAVSTLERMLIFAPGLARVQLELGVLYYRLGAYATARAYLEAAVTSTEVPPDVHGSVQLYLQQIAVLADPPPFSGTLYTGLRWQSNANSGPGSREVTLNGLQFTLDDRSTGVADWSVVNVATVRLVHDPKRQGDLIEAGLLVYSGRFFERKDVNLEFVEATLGPSFNMKRYGFDRTRLHLYGIGDYSRLGDENYFRSAGLGARLVTHGAERASLELRGEWRHRTNYVNDTRPTADLRDGNVTLGAATYAYRMTPNVILSLQGHVQRENLDAEFFSKTEFAASAGLAISFASPLHRHRALTQPWLLQVGGGAIKRLYDEPDPTIDPTERQEDDVYWSRAAVIVPVGQKWAVIPQVEYRDQSSNYEISKFDNLTVMIGAQKRF